MSAIQAGGDTLRIGIDVGGTKIAGVLLAEAAAGAVENIANLDIVRVELGGEVARRTGVPTRVENDVNAAALGAAAMLPPTDGAGGSRPASAASNCCHHSGVTALCRNSEDGMICPPATHDVVSGGSAAV